MTGKFLSVFSVFPFSRGALPPGRNSGTAGQTALLRPLWLSYVLAVAVTMAAFFMRRTLDSWIGSDRPVLILFEVPIVISAYLGGMGPAFLSTFLISIGVPYLVLPPVPSWSMERPVDWMQWAIMVSCGVLISIMSGMLHRSKRGAMFNEKALIEINETLEQRVAARTAELVASEELLKRSQEIARLGSWELDIVNNHLSWTEEAYRIFGLKPQEFDATYEAFLEAVHPDDRVAVDSAYSASVRQGTDTYEIEHRIIRKSDGEVRIVHEKCNHFKDESGRIVRSVGMVHDITERKRAEKAQKESEEKYRALFEHMNEIVAVDELLFDEQGNACDWRILDVNPPYMRALKMPRTDIVGRRSCEIYGDRVQEFFLPHFTHVVRTGEPVQFEQYFEPTQMHLLVSAFHLGGMRLATVTTDITKRKTMEEDLRRSRDELELRVEERTDELKTYMGKLEESNRALEDFASIASHDMQEPLRKVISFGNMLRQTYKDSLGETGLDYLNRILGATNRMQSLLKGLLEYSRVTTKADPFVEVELTKIIGEVLLDLEVRIERTGGKVLVGELPVIKGDPTQIGQLFQNLIGNALKFHKEDAKPVVEVRSAVVEGKIQIVVQDNGIGFEEGHLERIFAPFQRLHGKSSKYEGTGMGLAICRRIVERHGGSITAKSTPGLGASFIIRLPMGSTQRA